jgi:5-methylcytosine-specific restriction endonuclease McrA
MPGILESLARQRTFDEATVDAVWQKAVGNNQILTLLGLSLDIPCFDRCGTPIKRSAYGTRGEYGWEIDHDMPRAKGGGNHLANLQPLHWRNNQSKGDGYPRWCDANGVLHRSA